MLFTCAKIDFFDRHNSRLAACNGKYQVRCAICDTPIYKQQAGAYVVLECAAPPAGCEGAGRNNQWCFMICGADRNQTDEQIMRGILHFQARTTSENRADNTAFQNLLLAWRDRLEDKLHLSPQEQAILNDLAEADVTGQLSTTR